MEVILAVCLATLFACSYNGREEERGEYPDDNDDDQEFDEGEGGNAERRTRTNRVETKGLSTGCGCRSSH